MSLFQKLREKFASPPLYETKQNKFAVEHKSFDESDSLFADLDISGEFQEKHGTSCVDELKSVSKSGQKRKVFVKDSSQATHCDVPCKRLAKDSEFLPASNGQNSQHMPERLLMKDELSDVAYSGKMSEGVDDLCSGAAMSFCDTEMSDFDMFFPGSGNVDCNTKHGVEPLEELNNSKVGKSCLSSKDRVDFIYEKPEDAPVSVVSSTIQSTTGNNTVCIDTDVAKTPLSTVTVSLKERLKQTLHKNAKIVTPQTRTRLQQEANLQEVKKDIQLLMDEGSEFDVGPFYGLPSKVKDLFESQRGISELYGNDALLF